MKVTLISFEDGDSFFVSGDPCLQKDCSKIPYAVCQVSNGAPICACPSNCPSLKEPVCGDNKKTFDNECKMRQFSCNQKTPVKVSTQGECCKFFTLTGVA